MNLAIDAGKALETHILNHFSEMREASTTKDGKEVIKATINFEAILLDTSNPEEPAYKMNLGFGFTSKVSDRISKEYDPRQTEMKFPEKPLTAKKPTTKKQSKSKTKKS